MVPSIAWERPEAASDARAAASPIARTCSIRSRPAGVGIKAVADPFEQDHAELPLQGADLPAKGWAGSGRAPGRRR